MFSSKSFIVSGLTCRSLIHFEFIFVYGVRKYSSFILLHTCVCGVSLGTYPSGNVRFPLRRALGRWALNRLERQVVQWCPWEEGWWAHDASPVCMLHPGRQHVRFPCSLRCLGGCSQAGPSPLGAFRVLVGEEGRCQPASDCLVSGCPGIQKHLPRCQVWEELLPD